jgi:hypothetical protein
MALPRSAPTAAGSAGATATARTKAGGKRRERFRSSKPFPDGPARTARHRQEHERRAVAIHPGGKSSLALVAGRGSGSAGHQAGPAWPAGMHPPAQARVPSPRRGSGLRTGRHRQAAPRQPGPCFRWAKVLAIAMLVTRSGASRCPPPPGHHERTHDHRHDHQLTHQAEPGHDPEVIFSSRAIRSARHDPSD